MQNYLYTGKDYVFEAVAYLYGIVNCALSCKKTVNIALSGGATPVPIYKEFFQRDLDWERINLFMVDDRCVDDESPDSNYGNISRLLTTHTKVNFYQMYFPRLGNEGSAENYSRILERNLQMNNGFPVFDIVLLGIGEDGHTASLFPDSPGLKNRGHSVIYNRVRNKLPDRITLTYPVLLEAEKAIVLAKGDAKKKIISDINEGIGNYPIAEIVRNVKFLQWVLD